MSRMARAVYAHLGVVIASVVGTLWGLDERTMWTIIAVAVLSGVMTIHAELGRHCREIVVFGAESNTRCVLTPGHPGVCVDFYGSRGERKELQP